MRAIVVRHAAKRRDNNSNSIVARSRSLYTPRRSIVDAAAAAPPPPVTGSVLTIFPSAPRRPFGVPFGDGVAGRRLVGRTTYVFVRSPYYAGPTCLVRKSMTANRRRIQLYDIVYGAREPGPRGEGLHYPEAVPPLSARLNNVVVQQSQTFGLGTCFYAEARIDYYY